MIWTSHYQQLFTIKGTMAMVWDVTKTKWNAENKTLWNKTSICLQQQQQKIKKKNGKWSPGSKARSQNNFRSWDRRVKLIFNVLVWSAKHFTFYTMRVITTRFTYLDKNTYILPRSDQRMTVSSRQAVSRKTICLCFDKYTKYVILKWICLLTFICNTYL